MTPATQQSQKTGGGGGGGWGVGWGGGRRLNVNRHKVVLLLFHGYNETNNKCTYKQFYQFVCLRNGLTVSDYTMSYLLTKSLIMRYYTIKHYLNAAQLFVHCVRRVLVLCESCVVIMFELCLYCV